MKMMRQEPRAAAFAQQPAKSDEQQDQQVGIAGVEQLDVEAGDTSDAGVQNVASRPMSESEEQSEEQGADASAKQLDDTDDNAPADAEGGVAADAGVKKKAKSSTPKSNEQQDVGATAEEPEPGVSGKAASVDADASVPSEAGSSMSESNAQSQEQGGAAGTEQVGVDLADVADAGVHNEAVDETALQDEQVDVEEMPASLAVDDTDYEEDDSSDEDGLLATQQDGQEEPQALAAQDADGDEMLSMEELSRVTYADRRRMVGHRRRRYPLECEMHSHRRRQQDRRRVEGIECFHRRREVVIPDSSLTSRPPLVAAVVKSPSVTPPPTAAAALTTTARTTTPTSTKR